MTELSDQQSRIDALETYLQSYSRLFDSNITTPVSKIEAVAKALSSDGWNSSSLIGMEVKASLSYVRFFIGDNGDVGFTSLGSVTSPVDDYSPRAEYNVTAPGAYPLKKGTLWYRYVWTVVVHESGLLRAVPPPGLYWVDASTGELFKFNGFGGFEIA
jgi:hypothetical protein